MSENSIVSKAAYLICVNGKYFKYYNEKLCFEIMRPFQILYNTNMPDNPRQDKIQREIV